MNEAIHEGIITKIEGNRATLRLNSASEACKGCAMSMLCDRPQTVTAKVAQPSTPYAVGDAVSLSVGGGTRLQAIALLLAVPLALLLGGLWLGSALKWADGASALCGIGLCCLWYALLPIMTKAFGIRPRFEITKKND